MIYIEIGDDFLCERIWARDWQTVINNFGFSDILGGTHDQKNLIQ